MIRLLLFLAGNLGLFAIATLIGMGSYQYFRPDASPDETGKSEVWLGSLVKPERTIPFDAEPALLAHTTSPVDLGGDALGVVYVLQRDGKVVRIGNEGSTLTVATRYTDLDNGKADPALGFSAIAFHPDFLVKERPGFGKFYAVVAENAGSGTPDFLPEFGFGEEHHQDVVYEFSTPFPLAASFQGTRREVVRFSQPGRDNNLRSLTFDHHGHLYLAVGDGASSDPGRKSPSKNASSLTSAYGKVLRIDPTGNDSINGKYGIPETNPFRLVSDSLPELWAFGLRAPGNLHYDPFRRILCIGESSRGGIEKVNVSSYGGEHFGWDLTEGSFFFDLGARAQLAEVVTSPALSLSRSNGVVDGNAGNVVYWGERFPALAGKLLFASRDGQLLACSEEKGADPVALDMGPLARKTFSALRTTPTGELVVLCGDGTVYEMRKSVAAGNEKKSKRPLYCFHEAVAGPRG